MEPRDFVILACIPGDCLDKGLSLQTNVQKVVFLPDPDDHTERSAVLNRARRNQSYKWR